MSRTGAKLLALFLAGSLPLRLWADPPPATPPAAKSLLFPEADAAALAKAIADYNRMKNTGVVAEESAAPPPDVPNIYVSGLAYYGDGAWTVWANGYRIVPGRQAPDFSVVSVSEDAAEITVGGSKPARFVLHPYQTWLARSNDIVEGIVP